MKTVRHVLGISGGKDSAALAIYMRDRVPEMEYFFCDTDKELPETYDFLARLEAYLGKPIARLNDQRGFDHWLTIYGGYLPSSRMRWCTRQLKIKPFEDWVGDDPVVSYVGIRADEDRDGYISTKPNIKAVFPFKEDGITKDDVFRLLEESGVGVPKYYEWRSRSGCYFCFFQRNAEWVGLKERHPELYEAAKAYEKPGDAGEPGFTWNAGESLVQLEDPRRIAQIKARHAEAMAREQARSANQRLIDVFADVLDDEDDAEPCLVCHL
ncbi:MAG: phosphoadenosine phosphosulfate reductase family protein [Myxococcales bacterium]|nr:phosphoadenosine phosphosulfate reductase family protein [Myxococcales bacterium]